VAEVKVIGAGPSGLMAAEVLAEAGHRVIIHDAMGSPARKFLLAGRGGLNLTHSEPLERFLPKRSSPGPKVSASRPSWEARAASFRGR
jgi:predicted flavoprotein YhiN